MTNPPRVDLCVIGAGSGGLSVAAGAARMGASVVLIERDRMGGDCLNVGCVPSKSLLAAGRAADEARRGARFGIVAGVRPIDGQQVHAHVHGVIAAIAPHDSQERFEALGVQVVRAQACFIGPDAVQADGRRIRARRYVVATGSRPLLPPIPGLGQVAFLTNETVFDLQQVPRHLVVVGGGPIGVELAQAFRELGAEVTLVEQATILAREDDELVAVLRSRLAEEGIVVHEGAMVTGVAPASGSLGGIRVTLAQAGAERRLEQAGAERRLEASHLLLAAGRAPVVDGLGLAAAGIAVSERGIVVDRRLRTSNRRVFAIGDVAGGPQFTHVAGYHAGIVLRNALFRMPAKADHDVVPRVTYAHPELAQVGLHEAEAQRSGLAPLVLRSAFAENDRAQTERATEGLVKAVVDRRGRILGAGIVGAQAGELIHVWVLAMQQRLRIGALATMIAPYPTLGEANKRAAGEFYAPKLFGPRVRRLVRLLGRLG